MGHSKIKELLVFSSKPDNGIIEFCSSENILVVWRVGEIFQIYNKENNADEVFNPGNLI